MSIIVRVRQDNLIIEPENAITHVDEPVEWIFIDEDPDPLPVDQEWMVFFHHGSPFPSVSDITVSTSCKQSVAKSPEPKHVGSYKYGIKVQPKGAQKPRAIKDPILQVIP